MNNADMPAMPQDYQLHCEAIGDCPTTGQGFTKREMIAMHLHAALLTATTEDGEWCGVGCDAAEIAVTEADELLKRLAETTTCNDN